MIEFNHVTLQLRDTILDDFSAELESGKVYGLVAVNGTGKTSLFRGMMGLISFQRGEILIDGLRIEKMRKQVFFYENSDWLSSELSVLDY